MNTLSVKRMLQPFGLVVFATLGLLVFALGPTPLDAQSTNGQVRLVSSDASRVVLNLVTPQYQVTDKIVDGKTYSEIQVQDWGQSGDVGEPQVPVIGAMVAVPAQARVSFVVTVDETNERIIANPVLPAPNVSVQPVEGQPYPEPGAVEYVSDPSVYASNAFSPADRIKMSVPAYWRSQRYVNVYFHPFQYNPVTRQLKVHNRVRVEVKFSYPENMSAAEMGSYVDEGGFEDVMSASLINYSTARNWRSVKTRGGSPEMSVNTSATSTSYKLAVSSDGIYKVLCEEVNAVGEPFDSLHLTNQGTEVAISIFDTNTNTTCDTGEYFVFYGRTAGTRYTDTNIYWFTLDGAAGKRMSTRSASGGTLATSFADTVRNEQNLNFYGYLPYEEGADHWFGRSINQTTTFRDYTLNLLNPVYTDGDAQLHVNVMGFTTGSHHLIASVNGTALIDQTWAGQSALDATAPITAGLILSGNNTVRLSEIVPSGQFDTVFINYAEIKYQRAFIAQGDLLRFR